MRDITPAVISAHDLAKMIDHTLLAPNAILPAFDALCREAMENGFHSVCVNSCRVPYVAGVLKGSGVKVCAVVGFPLGAMAAAAKAFEARRAVSDGAAEIDMVLNIGFLRSGDLRAVEDDVRAVRRAARGKTLLKVIIETVFLTRDEKISACTLAKKAGADFVKTCTGFLGGGATVEDVALMRETIGPDMGVKASGGIRTLESAVAMIRAGATRIGCSAGVAIVAGAGAVGGY